MKLAHYIVNLNNNEIISKETEYSNAIEVATELKNNIEFINSDIRIITQIEKGIME